MKTSKKILNAALRNVPLFRLLNDKIYLSIMYKLRIGKRLNLDNPKLFNEKLQWLKLYDRKPIYTTMVDKYEVKKYVTNIIGKEYIIPTIGIYEKFEDIDFDKLPNQFVIKCTHDSGGIIICKNKSNFDKQKAEKIINKCLKRNFYWAGREWPYKNVKPRIIVEKYMEDKKTEEARDYKFFCFNGEVKLLKIDFNRFKGHRANYYNPNGTLLKFGEEICPPDYNKQLKMPQNLKTMVKLSEKLSNGTTFLRVDFYEINGNVFFGELTLFPASGLGKFTPSTWDKKLGDLINLSLVKK